MVAIDRRVGYIFVAFLSLLAVAVFRAVYLGVVKADSLQQAAVSQQITNVPIPATRGAITDRNGVELALSESAADVIADPYLIKRGHPMLMAQAMAPLLHMSVLKVLGAITKPHTGYVVVAHEITPATAQAILALKFDGKPINGITSIPDVKRVYPRDFTAAQVLGGVHASGAGDAGLEYQYNSVLSGKAGERRIVNDAIHQPISIDEVSPMQSGKTLQLTLDAGLQNEVEQVLAGVGEQYQPRAATAIAMNPDTGAILALANWPQVNANDPNAVRSPDDRDHAVADSYEPGSTFKAITVAGALQDGVVTPSTAFDVPPVLQVADRQIHDAEAHGYETLTTAQILKVSSNIGADLIGARLGADRFAGWVRKFGFGSTTGSNIPGEQTGIILKPSQYSGSSMGNLPMGQGESVTPIQMATAYSAIANGGILRRPHIVESIGGKAQPIPAGHRIISTNTAAEVRDMLRGVLADGGTASGAAIHGFDLAGKTGTANVVVDGKYSSSEYIASFIGMVPASDPKLVVAVMVDEPQGSIYGGSVAAPAFQKIVGWAVPHFGISPN
ncbi:MAG TPA: penicillin-binding protein 2 [Solirubrobacteraceae bacterium]|nr:penicillin-binding protein 2 [Solirubrobacteraceae bacterium]